MQQIKVFDNGMRQEPQINEWLKENPGVKIVSVFVSSVHDLDYDGHMRNQWESVTVVYESDEQHG